MMNVHFACNSCGKCCSGHHLPLTLSESLQWASDGSELIILIEAFFDDGYGVEAAQREHAQRRSVAVRCGEAKAHVAITFAAYNPGTCRYLSEAKLCGVYERRPLVCRIYPMEINPHLPLRPENKDCPPETWQAQTEIFRDGKLVNAGLAALIEQSRQADRDDIGPKARICQELGITVAALKGRGFMTYRPSNELFLAAVSRVTDGMASQNASSPPNWSMFDSRQQFSDELQSRGAAMASSLPAEAVFIAF